MSSAEDSPGTVRDPGFHRGRWNGAGLQGQRLARGPIPRELELSAFRSIRITGAQAPRDHHRRSQRPLLITSLPPRNSFILAGMKLAARPPVALGGPTCAWSNQTEARDRKNSTGEAIRSPVLAATADEKCVRL